MAVQQGAYDEDVESHVNSLHALIQGGGELGHFDHASTIADSEALAGPTKLAVLAKMKADNAPEGAMLTVASSLVNPDVGERRDDVAAALVHRVDPTLGKEPLGRVGLTVDPDDADLRSLMADLVPDVQTMALSVLPKCQAQRFTVKGQPALFVRTDLWTAAPLTDYVPIIDPLEWPNCPVQAQFFESMTVAPGTQQPLTGRDTGWKAVIREKVNFGPDMGIPNMPTGVMETDLKMMFSSTHNDDGDLTSIGATYQLAPNGSIGNHILHDEGYLLAQDLEESAGLRRITTLKAVWFTKGNTPPDEVCPIWSLSSALVSHHCTQSGISP